MKQLIREAFTYKDSVCQLISDKPEGIQTAKDSIKRNNELLKEYIALHPKFGWTLWPIPVPTEPLVAKLMAEASEKACVGPMAAVAGVLADLAVKDMLGCGCRVAVVENGGEVSAVSDEPVDVAVAVGEEPMSKRFGFRLTDFPIGLATSSGRFSHALSFGDAEAATVFCQEAGLADAAATAVGNVVKGENVDAAIQRGLDVAKTVAGIEGAMVIYRGKVGTWGKIPEIIKVDPAT
jgi:ApbE superfamily uncharacterized protein (UPF0280 family)